MWTDEIVEEVRSAAERPESAILKMSRDRSDKRFRLSRFQRNVGDGGMCTEAF